MVKLHAGGTDRLEVLQSLDTFRNQVILIFARTLGNEAFASLGDTSSPSASAVATKPSDCFLCLPDCDCSTESDWCDWVTNPDPGCKTGFRKCHYYIEGCGTLWQYGCNGLCE